MSMGEQIQRHREQLGWSQNDLAEKLDISRQSISKWENGTSVPSFSNVVTLSQLFDMTIDDLVKGSPELIDAYDQRGWTPIERIVFIALALGFIATIIGKLMHITDDLVTTIASWGETIGFIGAAITVDWHQINKGLTKLAILFGIIWIGFYAWDSILSFMKGFIAGINSYHAQY